MEEGFLWMMESVVERHWLRLSGDPGRGQYGSGDFGCGAVCIPNVPRCSSTLENSVACSGVMPTK